jgi:hypothetical protein
MRYGEGCDALPGLAGIVVEPSHAQTPVSNGEETYATTTLS